MRQGIKLRSLDKHNENIVRLVEIQQCNAYINAAQKAVNAGDINKAVAVLRQGVTQYPDNVTLRELLPRVKRCFVFMCNSNQLMHIRIIGIL